MSLVEVALAILLVGALAAVIIALSTTLRAGTEAEGDWKGFLAATTLAELAGNALIVLPSCPTTRSLSWGDRTYQVCIQERMETVGTLSRQISTVEVYEGGTRLASLSWAESYSVPSSPIVPGTCSRGNRRQVIFDLGATGMTYVAFALTWTPNVPAGQTLKVFRQLFPSPQVHYQGSYLSGDGFVPFSRALVLTSNTRIRLDFSDRFKNKTNYSFNLRLRDSLGREYAVSDCTVRW
ncbi:MAG: hypothetical protein ABWJ63_05295 [Thermus sp.]|uniref:Prepilin-like protein n=1 Tax=Thermus brevis TaxID=2862456 RepID=A0ABS6ZYE1_9DEIN|nr:hypothetical protein [Thermus brevis]MBW6394845.1 hypothetical protein [Thermus brevis]